MYIRGTNVYPGYKCIYGVQGYIRSTRVYPGYEVGGGEIWNWGWLKEIIIIRRKASNVTVKGR